MRNVRIRIAYDGAQFFGWQRQDGFNSVQQELEEALLVLTGTHVTVYGAGRTDSGVHALGQVAHFHLESRLSDDRLRHALNARTSRGLIVERAETCPDAFHARFDARSKRYAYVVSTRRFRSPIQTAHAHWISMPLALAPMRAAAGRLVGTHDFRAFGNTGSPRKSTVRTLNHVRIVARRHGLAMVFQADGFLYNMVRNLAGTLLDVGLGKRGLEHIDRALATGERTAAGPTAPACGLYLVSVQYPSRPFRGVDDAGMGAPGAFGHRR